MMRTIVAGTDHCEFCDRVAELRPYGPNGEFVCFTCMKKDEESAKKRFAALLNGGAIIDARDPLGSPRLISPIEGNTDEATR